MFVNILWLYVLNRLGFVAVDKYINNAFKLVKLNKCEFHIHSVDPQKKIIFILFYFICSRPFLVFWQQWEFLVFIKYSHVFNLHFVRRLSLHFAAFFLIICWVRHSCEILLQLSILKDPTLVVLGAVFSVVEALHHLGVLLGGKHLQRSCHLLAVSGVRNKSSKFTHNSFDALLWLHDGHVHVLDSADHVAGAALIFIHNISLPSASAINCDKCGK